MYNGEMEKKVAKPVTCPTTQCQTLCFFDNGIRLLSSWSMLTWMIKSLKEELFIPFETECLFGHKGSRWTIPRPYLRLRFQYFPIKELQKEAKTKAQLGAFQGS